MRPRAAFVMNDPSRMAKVYGAGRRERVEELCDCLPEVVTEETFDAHAAELADCQALFSTWGMPRLDSRQLARMPALEVVFYAAGTVQFFARPFLERGVQVVSSWAANAVPVAEFTLGQVLLSCKRYFENTRLCRDPKARQNGTAGASVGRGAFGASVALIGMGMIGRRVAQLLQPFDLEVLGVDPYVDDDTFAALGVRRVSLEEAFSQAYVISNHLPNLPATVGMLGGALFASMPPGATFINTGRGAQVREAELIDVLSERTDLTALLDVTLPEPPAPDSPLYTLPNVHLSSHIAGSLKDEWLRLADYAIEECQRWLAGEPLRYAVTEAMLDTMA
jgi:phosphoglycerate dehydrogenase-like enzyme